ncbi:flagellar hook assembly protein FlgD [Paenibacillus wenxiniae]|uniref:Basal-body rod modification protein FlgD n=1 Tax=Paenibacillus wenxiniae TaxID=1636843 RepID=A0ABW4RRW3_9BACL
MPDLISTSNTWPNYSTSNVQAAAASKKKDLGKDQFLSILVAQLKNQDPTAPMDNAQFVAQMAQFSSVEQLISINDKMDKMQGSMDTSLGGASELIGKKITWLNEKTDPKTGATISSTYESGKAESIILKNKVLYAQVGEDAIPLSLITKVEPGTTSGATTAASETPATSSTTPAASTTTPAASTATPTTGSTTTPAASTETPASTSTGNTSTSDTASTSAATENKSSEPASTATTGNSASNNGTTNESTAAPAATATGSKTSTETTDSSDSSTSTTSSSAASTSGENAS